MSMKDKLSAFFFGPHSSDAEERLDGKAPSPQADGGQSEPALSPDTPADPSQLELAADHPLKRLYELRRKEVDHLSLPSLCLDSDGVLPPEVLQREKPRLQQALALACNARLKKVKSLQTPPEKAGKKDGEEPGEGAPPALDALPCFFLSADKLYAWCLALPPVGTGGELSREALQAALAEKGLRYGLDDRLLDHLVNGDEKYFRLLLIARGQPALDGRDGSVVDYFPRVVERILDIDEYDRVDYAALHLIHNVTKGQEICRLVRPTEGEPGRTVLDEEIPAKSGKLVPLPKGRNTEVSEDGSLLLASIDGHVEFTGRSFQVKPVLDIPGNVDFSTGNINFLGDVNIRGDVMDGFSVRAMGNIHVAGVVEAGAMVEAGGDLFVVRGIMGEKDTIVQAHRSLFAKYIENATICVQENLQADCIINSGVFCGGEVQVRSGRGRVMGGRIWAAGKISAKVVGTLSESRTAIELGGTPCLFFERETAQREVQALEMELERLECQPDSDVKAGLLDKTQKRLSRAELKLKALELNQEEEERAKEADGDQPPAVQEIKGCLEGGIVYPNTEIIFGEETLLVRQTTNHCVAKLVKGEIVLM